MSGKVPGKVVGFCFWKGWVDQYDFNILKSCIPLNCLILYPDGVKISLIWLITGEIEFVRIWSNLSIVTDTGSAPDISGQGKANPIAMILSFAMMLRYSLDRNNDADLVEKAVTKALEDGLRTADIMQKGKTLISTEQMGTEICNRLDQLAV